MLGVFRKWVKKVEKFPGAFCKVSLRQAPTSDRGSQRKLWMKLIRNKSYL